MKSHMVLLEGTNWVTCPLPNQKPKSEGKFYSSYSMIPSVSFSGELQPTSLTFVRRNSPTHASLMETALLLLSSGTIQAIQIYAQHRPLFLKSRLISIIICHKEINIAISLSTEWFSQHIFLL